MKSITLDTDKLGSATLVGNFENGSDEWHKLRATGIGGSDIAAAVGCSPWTSPFALWARKTGKIEESFTAGEAAEWGNRLESVVLDKFEEEHPELVVYRNPGTWANVDRPWQLANPDAIYEGPDGRYGIIEVKTSRYEDDWTDGVPRYYQTQIQWYSQTFSFSAPIFVAALFAGSKYREFEVAPDPVEQGINLATVEMFREYLLQDKQPDYDGATSTLETVRQMHPMIDDSECELGTLGQYYFIAVDEYAAAEKKLNEMKSRVLDAMGNAKKGLIEDEWVLTRQANRYGTISLIKKRR